MQYDYSIDTFHLLKKIFYDQKVTINNVYTFPLPRFTDSIILIYELEKLTQSIIQGAEA